MKIFPKTIDVWKSKTSAGKKGPLKECGPTIVGDEYSDEELMQYLGAKSMKALGNNFTEYRTNDPPRIVLDKLEKKGYKVLSTAGIGSTFVWTLHKDDGPNMLYTTYGKRNISNIEISSHDERD